MAPRRTMTSDGRCERKLARNVPAGKYRLEAKRNGSTGTYNVAIGSV